jgi:putative PEP-CTERM system histidine kinase
VNLFFLLPFVAGAISICLALLSLLRAKRSPAAWFFFAGMLVLGVDSLLTGLGLGARQPGELLQRVTLSFLVKCTIPGIWLGFSVAYSRGTFREELARWKGPILLLGLLPLLISLAFAGHLYDVIYLSPADGWRLQAGPVTKPLNVVLVVGFVLVLMNLEQTFRSTVGTMRWQIKFVVLALALVHGVRLYVRTQVILFSAPDIAFWNLESASLLIGCFFLVLAYARTGWREIDVYPSAAVVRSSLTILIVGSYLLVVGVLAQVVKRFGGVEIFQFQAMVVLAGLAGLAVLLLSDRARQKLHVFVTRHFARAQHDSAQIWSVLSRRLASVTDAEGLSTTAAKLISDTFDVLSVNIWLDDPRIGRLRLEWSTSQLGTAEHADATSAVCEALRDRSAPFDLDDNAALWAEELRRLNPTTFPNGGHRLCVPLRSGDELLGAIVLADRVNGAIYTAEELELLKCLGDQITSVLLGLRLNSEVAAARELDALRTMSAFFVHDLKNAVASLNLMLTNLPVHFDDPGFREDALRSIGNTARRMDDTIARLTTLRERPAFSPRPADLNQLVAEALDRVNGMPHVEVTRELQPVPRISVDSEQIQSVVTNLVMNARDAVSVGGRIRVRTEYQNERVVLSVSDNGSGMSPAFVKDSLFRPFQSTKKKGLGIGLFQSQAIVQAHGGSLHVKTEVGKGTTFFVSLPATGGKS